MSEELLINVTPQETRVAYVENGVLQEVHIERAQCRGLVGNVYKGKVCRVLPGMQAAFLDVGLARTAFLHVSDILNQHHPRNDEQAPGEGERTPETIMELLREGRGKGSDGQQRCAPDDADFHSLSLSGLYSRR